MYVCIFCVRVFSLKMASLLGLCLFWQPVTWFLILPFSALYKFVANKGFSLLGAHKRSQLKSWKCNILSNNNLQQNKIPLYSLIKWSWMGEGKDGIRITRTFWNWGLKNIDLYLWTIKVIPNGSERGSVFLPTRDNLTFCFDSVLWNRFTWILMLHWHRKFHFNDTIGHILHTICWKNVGGWSLL